MSVDILVGDALTRLRELPDQAFAACVTSPPYFNLRDYEEDGQIGLKATPEEFIAKLVEVFREVRRVLRDDGTLWINIGDSYASSGGMGRGGNTQRIGRAHQQRGVRPGTATSKGDLKRKDLIGIPWMLAFALRADGWYLRQEVIWSKPNPMPESVEDRLTKAHESLFLLAKSGDPTVWRSRDTREWSWAPDHDETLPVPKSKQFPTGLRPRWTAFDYYFDQEAIAEPLAATSVVRLAQDIENQAGSDRVPGKEKRIKAVARRAAGNKTHRGAEAAAAGDARHQTKGGLVAFAAKDRARQDAGFEGTRNKRSVWTVATQPSGEDHFATYPPALIEPCILAGSPPGSAILDPFGGIGTTGIVANALGRTATLIEISPKYATIARHRIGVFARIAG